MRTGIGSGSPAYSPYRIPLDAGLCRYGLFRLYGLSGGPARLHIGQRTSRHLGHGLFRDPTEALVRPILISSMEWPRIPSSATQDPRTPERRRPRTWLSTWARFRSRIRRCSRASWSRTGVRIYYQSDRVLKSGGAREDRDEWYFRVKGNEEQPYEINDGPRFRARRRLDGLHQLPGAQLRGRFIGAAGIGINIAAIAGMTAEYRQKYGRSVYFVDKEGKIVAGAPGGIDALHGERGAEERSGCRRTIGHRLEPAFLGARFLPVRQGRQEVAP